MQRRADEDLVEKADLRRSLKLKSGENIKLKENCQRYITKIGKLEDTLVKLGHMDANSHVLDEMQSRRTEPKRDRVEIIYAKSSDIKMADEVESPEKKIIYDMG